MQSELGNRTSVTRTVAVAATCLALTGASTLAVIRPTAPEPQRSVFDGYDLVDGPEEALSFSGNETIFDGVVTGVGSQRAAQPKAAEGITLVYTPVRVRVSEAFTEGLRPGQEVTLRILGGEASGYAFNFEGGFDLEDLRPGTRILVYGQPIVDVGDGVAATTPNFVFSVDDRHVTSLKSGNRADVDAHLQQLRARGSR